MNATETVALPPAVVVHGAADVAAALAPGQPVTLLSARGAASYAGAAWWRALAAAARTTRPGLADILDCADAPGRALEALRLGQKMLVLEPACTGFAEVADIAAGCGARVLPARPPALDLADRKAARHLAAWLSGRTGAAG